MEAPSSTKELKSFLGMVNYLGKFIPNLADKLQPLNSLLSTKNEWVWDEPQKKSFNLLKQELVSRPNLALFDPSRTTIVSADASSFGIGGVLRQEQPDGSLKPIAYVSRTLSETEKRYSQIEKEGLAIVWTCDRLKDYVTGIDIHIETDHKPLIAIFTSKSLEDMTPRLQRLKMRMMRYSYQMSHIAGKKQIVADMLSRKPMSKPHKDELEEELSAYIQSIEFPATEERLLEISRKQKEDSLCSQLAKYCMSGWPKNKREVDPALKGYWQFQEDLTYQNGLLLRGQRILIPKSLRKDILEKLHQGHFGINKCRFRAKESVWWLGISQEIERMVSSCTKCLKERKPKHEPLMPSEFPIRPWQKVGMDLFYLNGRWYLIVCDYYSRHGTPETVRSDNGPQFQKVLGSEFSKFSKEWSFKHITSSPKFPQSNGFIGAIIKNMKQSFKKEEDCYLTLQEYRTMPLESGYSPAELLMGRRLRTSVPAIESSLMPSLPPLQQGDSVWIRDQRVEGTVLHKSEEPRSYWVQTPQGKVRRNRLHLTPLPKMGSTMDASEDGQRQEQRNEETPLRHQPGSQGDARMTRSKRPRRIALHQRPHLQEMEGCRGTTKTRIQRRASLQCQPCIQDMEGQSRYPRRKMEQGREEDSKEPMKSDPDYESGENTTFPKKETTLGRTQEVPPSHEDVTPPPPVSDVLGRLTTTLHQLSAVTGLSRNVELPRYDGSYEAQSFFTNYDAQADRAQLQYSTRLRKPPNLLQAPLRVTNTRAYAWAFPSKSTSTLTYIQTLKKVLQQGSPKRLLSDRAPAFTSEKFRKFLLSRGIQPLLTTSNNPQANGLIERLNATITGKLRLLYLENPKTSWTKLIKQVVQIYNQSPHTVTGFPPIFLMFNSIPPELKNHYNPFPDVQKARQLASSRTQLKHERDKQRYDKGHQAPHFEIGDLVLVKNYKHPDTGKLAPYFTGPFTIIEIISPNVVRINIPNVTNSWSSENRVYKNGRQPPSKLPPQRASDPNKYARHRRN
ncbi:K02A2.6-like [Cordylochernes scorpioides]|uniref:RNA-directed DNA polymerase n=1 Tax=Cordylochernes scorpioides TaxID=51811 RepID=A0ABY6KWR3_9ARAC|nr:K02A2.6-like [Cordylochernes scorpioides]